MCYDLSLQTYFPLAHQVHLSAWLNFLLNLGLINVEHQTHPGFVTLSELESDFAIALITPVATFTETGKCQREDLSRDIGSANAFRAILEVLIHVEQ